MFCVYKERKDIFFILKITLNQKKRKKFAGLSILKARVYYNYI